MRLDIIIFIDMYCSGSVCIWISSQNLDCYVIDNNGFILISKQQNDVSHHKHMHAKLVISKIPRFSCGEKKVNDSLCFIFR